METQKGGSNYYGSSSRHGPVLLKAVELVSSEWFSCKRLEELDRGVKGLPLIQIDKMFLSRVYLQLHNRYYCTFLAKSSSLFVLLYNLRVFK